MGVPPANIKVGEVVKDRVSDHDSYSFFPGQKFFILPQTCGFVFVEVVFLPVTNLVFMDSVQKKTGTTLSLTENHSIKLISKIEEDVSLQMSILQEKLIPLQEAEQMYTELKKEYDELSGELEDNKLLLETLVR